MSWSLIEWEAEAERLGGRFWQPAGPGRRIARAYFGGTTYVEVDLFQQSDEINELIPPRISFPRNAVITEETRIAANALARWRPDTTHADPPGEAQQRIAPDALPKGSAWRGWLWIALMIAVLTSVAAYSVAKAAESSPSVPDVYGIKSPEKASGRPKIAAIGPALVSALSNVLVIE